MKFHPLWAAAILLAGCHKAPDDSWQGYVEGEYVQLASPFAGQLQKLDVRRGDTVKKGQAMFALEDQNERASRLEAEERMRGAEARLQNLALARRAPEIEAQRAELAQARAARELSAAQLAQQERLFKSGFNSQARLDEAKSAHQRDAARVAEAEAQLRNASLPVGRDAERKAAERDVEAARAMLAQAQWRLDQKSVTAPADAYVQDTYFVAGEWVPAGRPVAVLLPPGHVKARFYVPEAVAATLKAGRKAVLACTGCAAITATVSYVSSQAEFTPPVLYGKEARGKLLYLVEARPEPADAPKLRPGQPLDVTLQ